MKPKNHYLKQVDEMFIYGSLNKNLNIDIEPLKYFNSIEEGIKWLKENRNIDEDEIQIILNKE